MSAKPKNLPRIKSWEQIKDAPDVKEKVINVPEWGGSIKVRGFTKAKQKELREQATDPETEEVDPFRLQLTMLWAAIIEPELSEEAIDGFIEKSAEVVDSILLEVYSLGRLTSSALEDAERTFLA